MDDVGVVREKKASFHFQETVNLEVKCDNGIYIECDKWLQEFQSPGRSWIQRTLSIYCAPAPALGPGIVLRTTWTTFLSARHLHSSWGWAAFSTFEYSAFEQPILLKFVRCPSPAAFCRLNLDFHRPKDKWNVLATTWCHNHWGFSSVCAVSVPLLVTKNKKKFKKWKCMQLARLIVLINLWLRQVETIRKEESKIGEPI